MKQPDDHLFAGLLEAAPDAMVCVDADGRIALVNAQTERLFGYGRDELIGQPVETLVPDAVAASTAATGPGTSPIPGPARWARGWNRPGAAATGPPSPPRSPCPPSTPSKASWSSPVVRDVTERLETAAEQERLRTQAERGKLERHLQQSQRLESLGQLAGGVAHDFNNLLGVISNYAAFVGEEVAKEAPDERWQAVRDDIREVQQATKQAAELTHQLLAFACQEMIQPRALNINDAVLSVEQLLIRTLGEHIELITDLADDLPPVLADAGQIEQVLVNLAVNARDAMPQGGKLIIRTASSSTDDTASQGELPPGRYVALKVSDTGTGIAKDVLDRVFEPFFTTKPKGEGTGLGLATVYGIITQAGGHVWIYSEPGLGTSLTALLPITEQDIALAAPPPAEPPRGHGQTILVVEDEPAMREVTRRILDRSGYHVVAAASGHEALDVLASQQEHIDVLLTDVIMPRMQGKELADRVRIIQPAARVVFMSGYTQGLLGAQGVLEPQVHLIEKPFSESALLTKLHEILSAHN